MHGDNAPADFIGNENDLTWALWQPFDQGAGLGIEKRAVNGFTRFGLSRCTADKEQIREPEGQTVDQNAGVRRRQLAQLGGEVQRFFNAGPFSRATGAVMRDAPIHFTIARFGRGEVNDALAGFCGACFRQQAFAGAGATKDQLFHGLNFR